MKSLRQITALLAVLVLSNSMLFAQKSSRATDEKQLLKSVQNFLDLWLIQEKPAEAVKTYFGSQTMNLLEIPSPILRKLWSGAHRDSLIEDMNQGYADLLASYRPPVHKDSLGEILDLPHSEFLAILRNVAGGKFTNASAKDRFVVFRADSHVVSEFMSSDNVLRPDIVPTYLVFVDFQDKSFEAYRGDGPLIIFWQLEDGKWKVQGFGGIPV